MREIYVKHRDKHNSSVFIEIYKSQYAFEKDERILLIDFQTKKTILKAAVRDVIKIKRKELIDFYTYLNNECDVTVHNEIDKYYQNYISDDDDLYILSLQVLWDYINNPIEIKS